MKTRKPRRHRPTPSGFGTRVPHKIVRTSRDQITDVLTLDGMERAILKAAARHQCLGQRLHVLDVDPALRHEYDDLGRAIQDIHAVLIGDSRIQGPEDHDDDPDHD